MTNYDVMIIGAGLLGCFTARALAQYDLSAAVLEAEEDVCTGISKANTGIVYSGIDNKPGSLKTKLTVTACQSFDELAKELDFPFRRTGSLMLSFGHEADQILKRKLARGTENGVEGARILSREETLEMEPEVSELVSTSLYVPSTGTVNPWDVGIAAFENAKANGIPFLFGERVIKIEPAGTTRGFQIETEKEVYRTKALINCAGLSSDTVREMIKTPLVRLFPTGADYLVLDTTVNERRDGEKGGRIRHILFHETEEKGKGVTIVPTVNGNLLVGPTEREVSLNMATSSAGLEELKRMFRTVIPDLPLDVIRTFASERPNPFYVRQGNELQVPEFLRSDFRKRQAEGFEKEVWIPEKKSISDFTILEEDGLFSFLGIKTPGLTCAAELGRYVAEKAVTYLGIDQKNPGFDPRRKGIISSAGLSPEERAKRVSENPAYGEILCRCRGITKGEVLEAIRRGAKTVEEVKFRAGTGMGRCQGAFCTEKIRRLLEEALPETFEPKTKQEGTPAVKSIQSDLVIIGGGAAGLSAAIEAAGNSGLRILLLEREHCLGGILHQCVHKGFGIHQLKKNYTGQEYAEQLIRQITDLPVEIKTGTTVLEITEKKEVYAVSEKEGVMKISAGAIILAMGCREISAGQLLLAGTRPEGVMTAGRLQYMMNIENRIPGKEAVILGSGDVGLIMARQLAQAGVRVLGIYEKNPVPGGLPENRRQCVEAYDIPLYLSHTVKEICGKGRVEGVIVVQTDEKDCPIKGTEKKIPCDLLVIAAGLIPENELSRAAGIQIDPETKGPETDRRQMTSREGIFAAGNVWKVMSLVDAVSITGETAARNAVQYLKETAGTKR